MQFFSWFKAVFFSFSGVEQLLCHTQADRSRLMKSFTTVWSPTFYDLSVKVIFSNRLNDSNIAREINIILGCV